MYRARRVGMVKTLKYDVTSIFDTAQGISEILTMAQNEKRIIITNDKDFGEKIFRERKKHYCAI